MDMMNMPPAAKRRLFDKFYFYITGVDEETLQLCPEADWEVVRAVGQLMVCTWLYQTTLMSVVSHKLFSLPGQIRPDLIAASAFIALFIALIDSFCVMRSGWHLSGIQELERGGVDISGGAGARIKAGIFLGIRIILSIGIAQLSAVFLSLLIFESDITASLQNAYQRANAVLIMVQTHNIHHMTAATRWTDATKLTASLS